MGESTCTIDGCDRPTKARGWCSLHYKRWTRHGDPLGVVQPKGPLWERMDFWSDRSAGWTACWLWLGVPTKAGYGVVHIDRWPVAAHRAAYQMAYGEIADGLLVLHSCDRPLCVNPAHLRVGTAQDNADDMLRRGRQRWLYGSANPASRLTEDDVRSIRAAAAAGTPRTEIAARHSVRPETIGKVVRRERWADVP